ncbi:MAG: sterol desaturase family protein [Oligoflexia bacterium]|nr:sterol desaturase family protein [Oligoflexia bacterium]
MAANKHYVSNKDETIRIFKNNLLEKLTIVHPVTPLVIFVPVVLYHLSLGQNILVGFLSGLIFWTAFEYFLHRYFFHWVPDNNLGKKMHFLFHGIHHDYPRDSKRLVMPPAVAIGLSALLYYFVFKTFLPAGYLHSFFAGFMTGYLCYDMTHFAIHHFNFKSKWFIWVRNHHYQHHYDDCAKNFGVSSPIWDYIMQSRYKKK